MGRRKRRDERDQDCLMSRHADLIERLAFAANLSVAGFIYRSRQADNPAMPAGWHAQPLHREYPGHDRRRWAC
jgi:hypothetical protein